MALCNIWMPLVQEDYENYNPGTTVVLPFLNMFFRVKFSKSVSFNSRNHHNPYNNFEFKLSCLICYLSVIPELYIYALLYASYFVSKRSWLVMKVNIKLTPLLQLNHNWHPLEYCLWRRRIKYKITIFHKV